MKKWKVLMCVLAIVTFAACGSHSGNKNKKSVTHQKPVVTTTQKSNTTQKPVSHQHPVTHQNHATTQPKATIHQKAAVPQKSAVLHIPQMLTIRETAAFGKLHKKAVTFNHKAHAERYGCVKCHHTYPNDAAVEAGPVKKCSECHKAVREPITVTGCEHKYSGGKMPGLKCAFHMNCWGCHEKLKKEGKPTGPTSCGKCHNTK